MAYCKVVWKAWGLFATALFSVGACAVGGEERPRIAVVDFEVQGDVGVPDVERIVPRLLLSEFAGKYEMVTRTQLQALLKEKNLQMSDLMDVEKAKQYGKLIPVKYLVVGEVMKGAQFWITAQLVEVGPGIIRSPRKISASTYPQLEKKIALLGELLAMSDDAYRNWQETASDSPKRVLLGDLIVQYPKILEIKSGDYAFKSYHGGVQVRDNKSGMTETVLAGEPGQFIHGAFKADLEGDRAIRDRLGAALTREVSIFNDALRVQVFEGGTLIFETGTGLRWQSFHERRCVPPR